MESQKIFNLLNEASDYRFVTRNGTLPMINQTRIMI